MVFADSRRFSERSKASGHETHVKLIQHKYTGSLLPFQNIGTFKTTFVKQSNTDTLKVITFEAVGKASKAFINVQDQFHKTLIQHN